MSDAWEDLLVQAFKPTTDDGDAVRIMVAGVTGKGKSRALRALAEYAVARGLVDLVMGIDDSKRLPQFSGHYRADLADYVARPPRRGPPIVWFRGNPKLGIRCHPDTLARAALRAARRDDNPLRTGLVLDELARVAADGYWLERRITVDGEKKKVFTPYRDVSQEGRALGVPLFYSTLDPVNVPRELKVQTSGVIVMGLAGPALPYTGKLFSLPSELLQAASRFERGEFAYYANGSGVWDGVVAKFPPPTPPEVQA